MSFSSGTLNGHDWVDLGLPSGTLWATCNVGTDIPEGYGDYFAWGEIAPKNTYNYSTYKYYMFRELTKYCSDSKVGFNGFSDNLIVLQSDDDAATANWGKGWYTPTEDQWMELLQNTTYLGTRRNDVNGMLFTAKNDKSIFLPASGSGWYGPGLVGIKGCYWSSSLDSDYNPYYAREFGFDFKEHCLEYYMESRTRDSGLIVRPVTSLLLSC